MCEVIRDYAFRKSDLPLIVSLEVHCSKKQQEILVETRGITGVSTR